MLLWLSEILSRVVWATTESAYLRFVAAMVAVGLTWTGVASLVRRWSRRIP